MGIDVAALAGLLLVLAAYVSYLVMLFVLHRFTYRTWLFHVTVIAGMLLALAGLLAGVFLHSDQGKKSHRWSPKVRGWIG